jgi:hypothetical protein
LIEITKSYWFSRKSHSHFFVHSKSINKFYNNIQTSIQTVWANKHNFFSSNICFGYRLHQQQVEFQFKFCKIEKKCFVWQKNQERMFWRRMTKVFFIFFVLNTYLLRWVGTLVYCKLISKTKLAKLNFESPSTVLQLLLINFCIVSFVQWFIWKKCFSCSTVIELSYENSTI